MVPEVEKLEESAIVENGSDSIGEPMEHIEENKPKRIYKIRLEGAALLISFAINLSSAVFQNQVLYQSCIVVFKYNDTVCNDIGTGKVNSDPQLKAIENIVQPFSSKIFMAESLVQAIIPAFIVLFIGAWSDKFGRKPALLGTSSGYVCFFVIKMIIAAVSLKQNVNPWIYIVASIPVSLSGGLCAILSAVYCYVADLTTYYERPYKMCLMSGIIALGELLGQLLSSYVYNASNACVVFAVSAAAQILAIIYIVFVINESVPKEQLSSGSKLRGFFDWGLLVEMFKTTLKKRPHFERATIWCILLPVTAITFDSAGTGNVFFLFARGKFGWTVQTFTTFNAINIVIDFVGAVAGIFILQKFLGATQTTMTLLAFGCYVVQSAFYAGAAAPWCLYVGMGVSFLLGIATPMGQSMLSNTVPPCDIGKVFALMTGLGAIAPLIASPLYTLVYNPTLATYPGAYNLISLGLYTLCFLSIGFVHIAEFYYPNVNKIRN